MTNREPLNYLLIILILSAFFCSCETVPENREIDASDTQQAGEIEQAAEDTISIDAPANPFPVVLNEGELLAEDPRTDPTMEYKAPSDDTCALPTLLTVPGSIDSTMPADYQDDYQGSCLDSAALIDRVYYFPGSEGTKYQLDLLSPYDYDGWLGVYIRKGTCDSPASEVGCSKGVFEEEFMEHAMLIFVADETTDYYVFVDLDGPHEYTLSVMISWVTSTHPTTTTSTTSTTLPPTTTTTSSTTTTTPASTTTTTHPSTTTTVSSTTTTGQASTTTTTAPSTTTTTHPSTTTTVSSTTTTVQVSTTTTTNPSDDDTGTDDAADDSGAGDDSGDDDAVDDAADDAGDDSVIPADDDNGGESNSGGSKGGCCG